MKSLILLITYIFISLSIIAQETKISVIDFYNNDGKKLFENFYFDDETQLINPNNMVNNKIIYDSIYKSNITEINYRKDSLVELYEIKNINTKITYYLKMRYFKSIEAEFGFIYVVDSTLDSKGYFFNGFVIKYENKFALVVIDKLIFNEYISNNAGKVPPSPADVLYNYDIVDSINKENIIAVVKLNDAFIPEKRVNFIDGAVFSYSEIKFEMNSITEELSIYNYNEVANVSNLSLQELFDVMKNQYSYKIIYRMTVNPGYNIRSPFNMVFSRTYE